MRTETGDAIVDWLFEIAENERLPDHVRRDARIVRPSRMLSGPNIENKKPPAVSRRGLSCQIRRRPPACS